MKKGERHNRIKDITFKDAFYPDRKEFIGRPISTKYLLQWPEGDWYGHNVYVWGKGYLTFHSIIIKRN